MEFKKERDLICEYCIKLVNKGLVARTWGNISVKISENFFLITPSGRAYEDLQPDDLSIVKTDDLTWEGKLKPSSEKNLHSLVYQQRPDVEAIIHTHQPAASSAAAARKSIPVVKTEWQEQMGDLIPCVNYALPTTGKLAKAVAKAAANNTYPAFLLSNHGTICLGKDLTDAFLHAVLLEQIAEDYILDRYRELSGNKKGLKQEMLEYYVKKQNGG